MSIMTRSLGAAAGLALAVAGAQALAQTTPPTSGADAQGGYRSPSSQAGANGAVDHPSPTQGNRMQSTDPAAGSTSGAIGGQRTGSPRMKSRHAAHGRGPTTSPGHAPDAQHSNGNHLNSGTTSEPTSGSSSGH